MIDTIEALYEGSLQYRALAFLEELQGIWETKRGESTYERIVALFWRYAGCDDVFLLREEGAQKSLILASFPSDMRDVSFDSSSLWAKYFNENSPNLSVSYQEEYRHTQEMPYFLSQAHSLAILPLGFLSVRYIGIVAWRRSREFETSYRAFLSFCYDWLIKALNAGEFYLAFIESEIRLEAILETLPQGIVFVDDDGRGGWVNKTASTYLDLSEGVRPSAQIFEAIMKFRSQASNVEEESETLLSGQSGRTYDWLWKFEKPRKLILRVASTPLELRLITGRLWVFDNITELFLAKQDLETLSEEVLEQQVELEQQAFEIKEINTELREYSQKLEEANTRKTEVLSILAHDLKSPLTSILSGIRLIEVGSFKKEDFPEVGGRMRRIALHMVSLIDNLLSNSAMEMGKISVTKKICDARILVEKVVERYMGDAQEKAQHLKTEIAGESLDFTADEELIEQVLENFVSNAIKYSERGKTITVRATKASDTTRFEVEDEGPGLTEEDKNKLFGFFQRLSARPTGGESSHGVGLAIVKRIVDLHEGKIWVESQFGKGSTFIVELPDHTAV